MLKLIAIAAYLGLNYLIWNFLKWYVPAYGHVGFGLWIAGCLAIALYIDRRSKRTAEQAGTEVGEWRP